jgi:hypothetical protein
MPGPAKAATANKKEGEAAMTEDGALNPTTDEKLDLIFARLAALEVDQHSNTSRHKMSSSRRQ